MLIISSVASAGLRTDSRTTSPLTGSTTGAGLPQVYPGALPITDIGPQVLPSSADRRSTRSISPVSSAECRRPSAKASSQGPDRTAAGIRNAAYVDPAGGNRRIESSRCSGT